MNNQDLENRIRDSFLTLAPNQFEQTMKAIEDGKASERKYAKTVPMTPRFAWGRMLAAAAVLLFCITSFGGVQMHRASRTVAVAIDVNPGVALSVNRKYCVEEVHGTNEDGIELLQNMDIPKGTEVNDAVDEIIMAMVEKEYIHDGSAVLISAEETHEKKLAELRQVVEQEVRKDIEECGMQEVVLACRTADVKQYGSGREALAKELVEKGVLTTKDVEALSVNELLGYSADMDDDTAIECISGDKSLVRKPEVSAESEGTEKPKKAEVAATAEKTAKPTATATASATAKAEATAKPVASAAPNLEIQDYEQDNGTGDDDKKANATQKPSSDETTKPTASPNATQKPDGDATEKPSSTAQATEKPQATVTEIVTPQPTKAAKKIKDKTQPTSEVDSDNKETGETEIDVKPTPEAKPEVDEFTVSEEQHPDSVSEDTITK